MKVVLADDVKAYDVVAGVLRREKNVALQHLVLMSAHEVGGLCPVPRGCISGRSEIQIV